MNSDKTNKKTQNNGDKSPIKSVYQRESAQSNIYIAS